MWLFNFRTNPTEFCGLCFVILCSQLFRNTVKFVLIKDYINFVMSLNYYGTLFFRRFK